MKAKSLDLEIVVIGLVTVALSIAGGEMALAGIPNSGIQCSACHHSGGGGGDKPLKPEYQGPEGCVNCHSSNTSSTTYDIDVGMGKTVTVPVVYFTGADAPTEYLAGGNFWWVASTGGADDTKGHNVLDLSAKDANFSEAPGNTNHCANSCHYSLATTDYNAPGCYGCHLYPAHHADDSNTVVGGGHADPDGYYRFLSGHMSGSTHGVCGIEDEDWEATSDATDHNEYLGWVGDHAYAAGFYNLGHTMTAFCCGCHGNYHIQNPPSARHPADLEISIAGAFGGGGAGTYDPDVPVARPSFSAVSDSVTLGTDMVMCLSCHRPHGSPYPKMLRWEMNDTTGKACSACHTNLRK